MRPVSPSTDTALANAITRPYYLVSIGFSTPEYITSAGSNITYDSNTYVPASVEVSLSAEPNLSIFNEGTTLGATVLADGVAGRTIRIYRGDLNDSNHPNPVMVFEGREAPRKSANMLRSAASRPRLARHPRTTAPRRL